MYILQEEDMGRDGSNVQTWTYVTQHLVIHLHTFTLRVRVVNGSICCCSNNGRESISGSDHDLDRAQFSFLQAFVSSSGFPVLLEQVQSCI